MKLRYYAQKEESVVYMETYPTSLLHWTKCTVCCNEVVVSERTWPNNQPDGTLWPVSLIIPRAPSSESRKFRFFVLTRDESRLRPHILMRIVRMSSGTNMTGRPGDRTMEMNGGSTASYLVSTLCVPVFFAYFNRSGSKGAFGLPGATWDHFRCTVEPSSSHIRCRWVAWKCGKRGRTLTQDKL